MTEINAAEADLLRRAVTACRNIQKQAEGESAWFVWVPAHLEKLADRIDPPADLKEEDR
jgi:hypothetical protein